MALEDPVWEATK